jgi:hypothetical protein
MSDLGLINQSGIEIDFYLDSIYRNPEISDPFIEIPKFPIHLSKSRNFRSIYRNPEISDPFIEIPKFAIKFDRLCLF